MYFFVQLHYSKTIKQLINKKHFVTVKNTFYLTALIKTKVNI